MELLLTNDLSEIHPASEETERFLRGYGAPPEILYLSRLVIEELVSNVIKYSYDDAELHTIRILVDVGAGELVIRIFDDGRPFNPLDIPDPDTSLPSAQRPVGGLGLHLVRKMTDSFEYQREHGWNVVTVRKTLPAGSL